MYDKWVDMELFLSKSQLDNWNQVKKTFWKNEVEFTSMFKGL
jgi:hypothetical protein